MPLSTEIFVMLIFLAGLPFYYSLLRDPQLKGGLWFFAAYTLLTLSNLFTVVEEFWFNTFFNFCEHLFIFLGAAMFVAAIVKMTAEHPRTPSHDRKP